MRLKEVRVGYYAEQCTDAEGNRGFVLRAHDPEVQAVFESVLRNGTRRRRELQRRRREREDTQ